MSRRTALFVFRTLVFALAGALAATTVHGAQDWYFPLDPGPGSGAYVRSIVGFNTSPATLFAGVYGGGVKKSVDAGVSWTDASNGIKDYRIRAIGRSSATLASAHIYIATEGGVFRTTDQGGLWTPVNNGLACTDVRALSIIFDTPETQRVIYAGTYCSVGHAQDPPRWGGVADSQSGVYKLDTATDTWSLVSGPANSGAGLLLNAIGGTPDGVNIHAATFTGRWTTNNATTGNTWTLRNGVAPNDLGGNGTAPSGPNNHNNIIAVGSNDYAVVQGMGVMVTTTADGGVNSYLPANSGLPVAAPFVRSLSGLFFTGGPCNAFYLPIDGLGLHKSTSPGSGWTEVVGAPKHIRNVIADPTATVSCNDVIYVATFAGMWKFDGATWTQLGSLGRPYLAGIASDVNLASNGLAYASSETVYRTTNSGDTWSQSGNGIDANTIFSTLIASSTTPNKVYVSTYNNGFFVSTDGGLNWSSSNASLLPLVNNNLVDKNMQFRVDSNNGDTIYAFFRGPNTARLVKSTNGGVTWSSVNNGLPLDAFVNDVRPAPSNSNTVYLSTSAGLYKSTNAAASWTSVSGLNIAGTGNIAVDPADEDLVAVATFHQSATGYALPTSGVYLSVDGGTTWQTVHSNDKINNIRWQRPSAAASPSLFVSTRGHGGESWIDSAEVGHVVAGNWVDVNDKVILTEARGGVNRAFTNTWGQVGRRIRSAITQSGYWRYRPTFYGPDFDGDGLSDVLWRHDLTGEVYDWRMDGRSIKSHGSVYTVPGDWQLVGTGDFDGDGRSDLLFRHATTGQNYMWMIENNTIHTQGSLLTLPDLNWKVAAVGDVDRDGRADIVWRYEGAGANQGLVYVWTMNGPTIGEAAPLLQVSDLNWRIVGIGDFDGDGFSDLFWWHQTTGQTYVWLLGPNTGQIGIKTSGSPFTLTDLNWRVAGVGDYNGDGRADIVWRNIATGLNAIWMMNGVSILSSGPVPTVTDQSWKIVGTGDYDGDGLSDLLWRNDSTGQNYLWRMNGLSIMPDCAICSPASTTGDIYTVSDTNWKVITK